MILFWLPERYGVRRNLSVVTHANTFESMFDAQLCAFVLHVWHWYVDEHNNPDYYFDEYDRDDDDDANDDADDEVENDDDDWGDDDDEDEDADEDQDDAEDDADSNHDADNCDGHAIDDLLFWWKHLCKSSKCMAHAVHFVKRWLSQSTTYRRLTWCILSIFE